ncbi:MAG: M55 family metallopeptidase [Gemmatimonadales bacterium]
MRVYISVDMEGIAGVVHEDQTDPTDPRHAGEYNRFRRLMTGEANAAIEGAVAAGARTVLVNDSHWLMRNLLAEELHPAAELLSGGPKIRSMMEGIEEGFDARPAWRFGRDRHREAYGRPFRRAERPPERSLPADPGRRHCGPSATT